MAEHVTGEREWRGRIEQWIPPGSTVAIVDVPVHRNVGDLFILAATHWLLASMNCRLVYAAGTRDYHTATARRAITADTVIVGLGGGNFGDLYPAYQRLRERVVEEFPDNRIVVLPQSIHFRDEQAAARSTARLARHRDLRIAVRDRASVEVARRMTPHTALMGDVVDVIGRALLAGNDVQACGERPARVPSTDGTLWLLRRDGESSRQRQAGSVDWGDVFPAYRVRLAIAAALMPLAAAQLSAELHERWASLATTMLRRAVAVMRPASHVVTDRLHGAIVARLAERPVTLIDNSYGKLTAYRDVWWRDESSIVVREE